MGSSCQTGLGVAQGRVDSLPSGRVKGGAGSQFSVRVPGWGIPEGGRGHQTQLMAKINVQIGSCGIAIWILFFVRCLFISSVHFSLVSSHVYVFVFFILPEILLISLLFSLLIIPYSS